MIEILMSRRQNGMLLNVSVLVVRLKKNKDMQQTSNCKIHEIATFLEALEFRSIVNFDFPNIQLT